MHESGMIRSLLSTALDAARDRRSHLRAVTIRLGVLAGGSADHLREHFQDEISLRKLDAIALDIVEDPEFLGGIEIVSVDLEERDRD